MRYQPSEHPTPRTAPVEALMGGHLSTFGTSALADEKTLERLSELSLSGNGEHCRLLLASVLRELSQSADSRWLTLVAPPAVLCPHWLRESGLKRECLILLYPRADQHALELTCRALGSGCSHTVVSWLSGLDEQARRQLHAAAQAGRTQSLNIRLGG